ncbi:MAG: 2OG-Fe(II) oxygenase [Actinobacteria bacterium]|nr:2OG-Fe(II) oxygenase [Actinomycetota bacterium]
MAAQRALVGSGERAADFVARRGDGQATRFYGYVGGAPAVLIFSGAGGEPAALTVRDRLREVLGLDTTLHVVATTGGAEAATFSDPQGAVHGAYGVSPDGPVVSVVVDPNVRVAATSAHDDPAAGDLTRVTEAVAAATHDDEHTIARRHAPVLLVPNALSQALCADLIARWQRAGGIETGVETTVGVERAETTDLQRKRRRDHTVTDAELQRTLSSHIGRRVIPELRKAFAYSASRFEGFKIGCYAAEDAGFFTAHRDNLSPSTAHRRFALSLNLNEDYDGGELRFPEYGYARYRPAEGEALVFSGSHLHEVLPVTRGQRFVLLSFLFGDEQPRQ